MVSWVSDFKNLIKVSIRPRFQAKAVNLTPLKGDKLSLLKKLNKVSKYGFFESLILKMQSDFRSDPDFGSKNQIWTLKMGQINFANKMEWGFEKVINRVLEYGVFRSLFSKMQIRFLSVCSQFWPKLQNILLKMDKINSVLKNWHYWHRDLLNHCFRIISIKTLIWSRFGS